MTQKDMLSNLEDIRFKNIIGMGLDFSSMIRLFERGSEDLLWDKLVNDIAPRVFRAQSSKEFEQLHDEFCNWGTKNITLAEKKRKGRIIKKKGPASYGQIAKTLDVALKVAVYYSHLPNFQKYAEIMEWLHAGIDNRMMKMLRKNYPNDIQEWPTAIEEVDKTKYLALQGTARKFIRDRHQGKMLLAEFDDKYWYELNP